MRTTKEEEFVSLHESKGLKASSRTLKKRLEHDGVNDVRSALARRSAKDVEADRISRPSPSRATEQTQSKTNPLLPFVKYLLAEQKLVAVDVGARGGVPLAWRPLEGVAKILAFDADADACDELQGRLASSACENGYVVLPYALAGGYGKRKLYLTNVISSSSLYNPDTKIVREYVDQDFIFPIRTTDVETYCLGDILEECGEPAVDIIKLDIQGAEMEVLRSLNDSVVSSLLAIELEVAMQRRSDGAPTFVEVHQWMSQKGFELFDIRPVRVHRTLRGYRSNYLQGVLGVAPKSPSVSARIWEVDALYFAPCKTILRTQDPNRIRRCAVLFCLYGFFTEALNLIYQARANALFSKEAARSAEDLVVSWHNVARKRWHYGVGWAPAFARWLIRRFGLTEKPNWWPHD